MHRFKDDLEWGHRLKCFREGEPTPDDIDVINENCVVQGQSLPQGIQIASYRNRERDSINCQIFEEFCVQNKPADGSVLNAAVVVFMDNLQVKCGKKTFITVDSNKVISHFYQHVGEDDIDKGSGSREGRVDPVLKLYSNCDMMLTTNSDVGGGEANGTRVRAQKVIAKIGEQPFHLKLSCGTIVWALYASQVRSILVKHVVDDIRPQVFDVNSTEHNFNCKLELAEGSTTVRMKSQQFPLVSNSCTTGHKLQGSTVEKILVNDWFYGNNWAYVVLSRVRTMAGLFMRHPLTHNLVKYRMPAAMKQMLKTFRDTIGLSELSDEDYSQLEHDTNFSDV